MRACGCSLIQFCRFEAQLLHISVLGLFVEPDYSTISGQAGLFKTGQWYMLGIQSLTAVLTLAWTIFWTYIFLKVGDRKVTITCMKFKEVESIGIRLEGQHFLLSFCAKHPS